MDTRLEQIGKAMVEASLRVHSGLGPGLLESAYQACLAHDLRSEGLQVQTERSLPVAYRGAEIDLGYGLDMVVENSVIVELKAVEKLLPIHQAQLLSYLKLSGMRLGYLLNFNGVHMREGIRRMVN